MASGRQAQPKGGTVVVLKLDSTSKLCSIKLTMCDELRNIFISPAMSCDVIRLYSLLKELRCQFVKYKIFLLKILFIYVRERDSEREHGQWGEGEAGSHVELDPRTPGP